jgi:peptide/nickel transport system permease protein
MPMDIDTDFMAQGGSQAAPDVVGQPGLSSIRRVLRFTRQHPTLVLGGVLLVLMILIAILAPYLHTTDPTALAPARRTRFPSDAYWFGTDMLGRDVYSRVIYGSRVSLTVGFSVAIVASFTGTVIGLVAGYVRKLDGIIMRMLDGLMSIPPILLAIALMALTRASIQNVIIAIAISEFPRVARLIRSVVLSLREQPYVEAAVTVGTKPFLIVWRHILPNTLAPLLVQGTFICASAMITEATLSFIGAGTPPIIPSWGNIMAEGRALWQVRPYIVFFPAIFLSVTVLAVNMLGDGLRDALDPRQVKRQ